MTSGKKPELGFTLIEMMIVVAVIAIIAAVAWPSYMDSVRKARRSDAQAVVMEAAQFMERFYTENNRYDQNRAGTAVALPAQLTGSPKDSSAKSYNISLQALANSTYTLRATPAGSQAQDGILELSNTGLKGWDKDNSGSVASTEQCWVKNC